MKRISALIMVASLLSGTAVLAGPAPGTQPGGPPPGSQQPGGPPPGGQQPGGPPPGQPGGPPPGAQQQGQPPTAQQRRRLQRRPPIFQPQPPAPPTPAPFVQAPGFRADGQRFSRGDRLPPQYRQDQYGVQDWRHYNLSPPPRGYRWYCRSGGNCFLVAVNTGVIRQTYWRDERDRYWRDRYARTYSYNDDIYYRECRDRPDPAGILIGGLIGGLIGSAARDRDDGAVFAGIIIGSVLGGALARDMDCEDRSYAYYSYYHGLNSGRPGIYRWRNPHNNHYGDFRVRSYYSDPYGFHCANYTNTAWLPGRRYGTGRACRQPNGAWAFVN